VVTDTEGGLIDMDVAGRRLVIEGDRGETIVAVAPTGWRR
jgi:hypothetical protein